MPMPTPLENESKQEFIDRFLSDSLMIEEYPDTNQRLAVTNSEWDKTLTKEVRRFTMPLIKEFEEVDGEFYSQGYVATTHPDRALSDDFDGDILSKEALQTIVDLINSEVATADGLGATRLVSYRHDWVKQQDPTIEPAGIVLPPAELRPLDNGHWGVWVKVHHNKNHPLYERTSTYQGY